MDMYLIFSDVEKYFPISVLIFDIEKLFSDI